MSPRLQGRTFSARDHNDRSSDTRCYSENNPGSEGHCDDGVYLKFVDSGCMGREDRHNSHKGGSQQYVDEDKRDT